jgi:hypothetical protein
MSHPTSQTPPPLHAEFAGPVRLPDHYADSPQAWFCSIDATFAASWFTRSLTKFHWALSKLPFTLTDSISPICEKPSAYANPYQEPGVRASQGTGKRLDHPGLGNNKPSVLWDQFNARQPATVKEIQTVLFLYKLPHYIRDLINPREFQDPETLTQWCNEIWENWCQDEGATAAAAAAAVSRTHSPFRGNHRTSSPFCGKVLPAKSLAATAHRPLARPGAMAVTSGVSTTPTLDQKL